MIEINLLILVGAFNLIMAATVAKRSGRYKQTSLYFVYSALAVVFWAAGDALMLGSSNQTAAEIGERIFLIAPLFTMYYLLLFAVSFPNNQRVPVWIKSTGLFTVLLSALLVLFVDILHTNISNDSLNIIDINIISFIIYATIFSIFFSAGSYAFLNKQKKSSGIARVQLFYVYGGATLSSIFAFFTNLLLPIAGNTTFVWLGPLFTLIYIISYSIAIARYRLFDIRRAVVRTLAYALSIATIVVTYTLAIVVVRDGLEQYLGLSLNTPIFYIGLTIAAVLLAPYVKKKFDYLTRTIFFRDDYDAQDVIDSMSGILLSSSDAVAMMRGVRKIMKSDFKITFVDFMLQEPGLRTHTVQNKYSLIEAMLRRSEYETISVISDDEQSYRDPALIKQMQRKNIAALVHLRTFNSDLGWMILGEKENGDPYDRQDLRTVGIMSDEIAIALENSIRFQQIKDFSITMSRKVNQATTELRHTNKKLKDLDHTKDEFISMASHQLRTPLTSIKGYVSMVLDGDLGPINDQQRKVLEESFKSSQRMGYLINDFLNISRLQNGKFIIDKTDVFLPEIIEQEIDQLRQTAQSRRITLNYQAPTNFPALQIDENKIRQVMMNFIDNAIYYSPADTTVDIKLMRHTDHIIFKVIDHGIGVPASVKHKLFTKFFRAENAQKARPDGTGIGLFMAKKVVVGHDGTIIFDSVENKGSTFGFRLPIAD